MEAYAGRQKGIDLAPARQLVEAKHEAEKKSHWNGLAQIVREQIGEKLEDHAEGVALAQGDIEEPHHPLRQQNEHADGNGSEQRLGNLLYDIAIYNSHAEVIGISRVSANAILGCAAGARTARR